MSARWKPSRDLAQNLRSPWRGVVPGSPDGQLAAVSRRQQLAGRPALVLNFDVEVDLVVKHGSGFGFDINQQKH